MHEPDMTSNGDLLTEPLFSVKMPEGRDRLSLPRVLHHLWRGEIISFDALQAHQRQPWHCFLSQLAALCFVRGGLQEDPDDPERWRAAILRLCDDVPEAFQLVVEDVSKPAFMQSPIPEGSLTRAKYKEPYLTPDELDMVVTAKNHHVKKSKVVRSRYEHWVYALVAVQTLEGYFGSGKYGIARMNGGRASRMLVSYSEGISSSVRFVRDVEMLQKCRREILAKSSLPYLSEGVSLCWVLSWGEGGEELTLSMLDPLYVEVCRKLRFVKADDKRLECLKSGSDGTRIVDVKTFHGVVGDPWMPLLVGKSMTLKSSGFTYTKVHQILFGENCERPPSLGIWNGSPERLFFVAVCLVRGEGGAESLHRREILIPGKIKNRLGLPSERAQLALMSQRRIEDAENMRLKVLYPALYKLLSGGRDGGKPDAGKLAKWRSGFEERVDERYFPALWDAVGLAEEEANTQWQEELAEIALEQLEDAIASVPLSSASYWRAVAAATSTFHACKKNRFG